VREVVEEIAFEARRDQRIDKRSGVSQRLPISCIENAVSNAERRALVCGEAIAVPRVTDVYAALPSITGKFELEYEGELKGADTVAREIIRVAVANVFDGYSQDADLQQVIDWFELGGTLQNDDTSPAADLIERASAVQGLVELASLAGVAPDAPAPLVAAALDFVLEGLFALKKISRSDEWTYQATEHPRTRSRPLDAESLLDDPRVFPGKKKYYN